MEVLREILIESGVSLSLSGSGRFIPALSLTPSIRFPNTRETIRESGESSESFRTEVGDHEPGLSHSTWPWSRTLRIKQTTQTVTMRGLTPWPDPKDVGIFR